jgi:ABC-type Fe3+-hydroxamate transport system substrate-binding protein
MTALRISALAKEAGNRARGSAALGWLLTLALAVLLTQPLFATRKLTDELGNAVLLPDHPHRIICLLPSVADDVYSLGAGNDVIAVSDFTKYPAAARLKPSIGLPLSPSMETIVALHPDLVIGSADLNRPENARQLSSYGLAVFMVNPHGLSGIYTSLLSIGGALNREVAAEALVAQLKARANAVRERTAHRTQVRVFLPVWYDPIVTIGKTSFISELIEAAGAKSVTDDITQEWPQVSLEAILPRQPDALVLIRNSKFSLKDLERRPGWDALAAIQNKRVYYLDDRAESPSPVSFDALEEFSKQLYP